MIRPMPDGGLALGCEPGSAASADASRPFTAPTCGTGWIGV